MCHSTISLVPSICVIEIRQIPLGLLGAAHASVGEYIDRFYNPTRRHSHLGYVSPIDRIEIANRRIRGIVRPSTESGEDHAMAVAYPVVSARGPGAAPPRVLHLVQRRLR
jgi:hypothetical protein